MAAPERKWQEPSRAREAMKRHDVVASGIITGIAGGVVLMAIAMLGASSEEIPATHPLRVIGESFVGPDAFDGVAAKIAFGAAVHLATSAGLGILFAAAVPRDFSFPSAIGVGVGSALLALMVLMPFIVPWANPGFRSAMHEIGGTWVLGQAAFGAVVGMAPRLRRRLAREASGASAPCAGHPGALDVAGAHARREA